MENMAEDQLHLLCKLLLEGLLTKHETRTTSDGIVQMFLNPRGCIWATDGLLQGCNSTAMVDVELFVTVFNGEEIITSLPVSYMGFVAFCFSLPKNGVSKIA